MTSAHPARRPGTLLALALALACVTACASDGPQRNVLPDRPEVHKSPQPEGLRDIRSSLASQRADTRESMDAQLVNRNELGTEDSSPGIFESAANALADVAGLVKIFY